MLSLGVVIVRCCGEFLLLQRSEAEESDPGFWGPPAGSVESNEVNLQAALRDLDEETEIKSTEDELTFFCSAYIIFEKSKTEVELVLYLLDVDQKPLVTLNSEEHQSYEWVTVEKASYFDLIEGNKELFAYLKEKGILV